MTNEANNDMSPEDKEMANATAQEMHNIREALLHALSMKAPHDPNDWEKINDIMFYMTEEMNDQVGIILHSACLTDAEKTILSQLNFHVANVMYMAMASIIGGHFAVLKKHGMKAEAHLHIDRVAQAVKEQSVAILVKKEKKS